MSLTAQTTRPSGTSGSPSMSHHHHLPTGSRSSHSPPNGSPPNPSIPTSGNMMPTGTLSSDANGMPGNINLLQSRLQCPSTSAKNLNLGTQLTPWLHQLRALLARQDQSLHHQQSWPASKMRRDSTSLPETSCLTERSRRCWSTP